MATLLQNIPVKAALNTRSLLWLAAVGILATLLALLAKAIKDNPEPSQDVNVLESVAGWDLWGLTNFFDVVSFLTGPEPGIIYGALAMGSGDWRSLLRRRESICPNSGAV